MSNDRTLVLSTVTATINASIEKVDIADWLFNLPDAEYQRCSPAHIAAGTTTTDVESNPVVFTIGTPFFERTNVEVQILIMGKPLPGIVY